MSVVTINASTPSRVIIGDLPWALVINESLCGVVTVRSLSFYGYDRCLLQRYHVLNHIRSKDPAISNDCNYNVTVPFSDVSHPVYSLCSLQFLWLQVRIEIFMG